MPHADTSSKMSSTQTQTVTNGDHKSLTLEHLGQYPIVNDGINTFKSYPLGQKSIEVADAAYARVGKPLEPHLRTPYSYARPYVNKADSLADQALSHVDKHVPIVKENTSTIFDTVKGYVFYPVHVLGSGKDYIVNTYDEEYKRTVSHGNRKPGLLASGLAIVSTQFHIASDTLQYAADWFNTNKDDIEQRKNQVVSKAKQKKDSYAQKAKEATE